jgi:hypothetical protein
MFSKVIILQKKSKIVRFSLEPSALQQVAECPSCGARVHHQQLGKHLISHFHYHRFSVLVLHIQ